MTNKQAVEATSVQCLEWRAASFKIKGKAWPYKRTQKYAVNPANLSAAGFYFSPTSSSPDRCICFLCGAEAKNWTPKETPFEQHESSSPKCPWVAIFRTIPSWMDAVKRGDVVLPATVDELCQDEEDSPWSKKMEDARIATFRSWWPYKDGSGFKCTAEQVARAGFCYKPSLDSPDMAECQFCRLALDGWEPEDDPREEHEKRSPNCTFFNPQKFLAKPKSTRGRKKKAEMAEEAEESVRAGTKKGKGKEKVKDSEPDEEEKEQEKETTTRTRRLRKKADIADKQKKTAKGMQQPVEEVMDAAPSSTRQEDDADFPVHSIFTERKPQPKASPHSSPHEEDIKGSSSSSMDVCKDDQDEDVTHLSSRIEKTASETDKQAEPIIVEDAPAPMDDARDDVEDQHGQESSIQSPQHDTEGDLMVMDSNDEEVVEEDPSNEMMNTDTPTPQLTPPRSDSPNHSSTVVSESPSPGDEPEPSTQGTRSRYLHEIIAELAPRLSDGSPYEPTPEDYKMSVGQFLAAIYEKERLRLQTEGDEMIRIFMTEAQRAREAIIARYQDDGEMR
ncbi:hypothetical protein HK102_002244 [Quaeritorhiza haematococci]|nr:hypothetical protein HK102_002244 [Quaeritorhiza haematococci]